MLPLYLFSSAMPLNKTMTSFSITTKNKNLEMKWIRTPKSIWDKLSKEFNFTVDACASDKNHLLPKYWTKDNLSLIHI